MSLSSRMLTSIANDLRQEGYDHFYTHSEHELFTAAADALLEVAELIAELEANAD